MNTNFKTLKSLLQLVLIGAMSVCAASSQSASRIEATITITNTPVTGGLIQFNSQGRWWTNNTLASTNWIITTNSTKASATNLYTHAVQNPWSNVVNVAWLNATSLLFSANIDAALSCTVTGAWASVTLRTNTVQTSGPIVMPYPTNTTETVRTNQASSLMDWLRTNSLVRPLATGSFSNLVDVSTAQAVASKTFTQSTYSGTIGALTNGYWTNGTLASPKLTNAVNYGSAFSSPGTNTQSEQFGLSAEAPGLGALAIGYSADSISNASIAIGYNATASGHYAVTLGSLATASGYQSITIGTSSQASGYRSVALGTSAQATHQNSIAIGYAVATAQTNEIRLGGSQDVVIGGLLFVEKGATNFALKGISTNTGALLKDGTYTNAILQNPSVTNLSGTASGLLATTVSGSAFTLTNANLREVTLGGSNTLAGDLALTARAVTTLANGYNSGVNIGTNYFVRLSGGTAGVTNAGFVAGSRDGEIHLLEITGGTNFVVLNDSGLEATAGNRIITGTGGTLVITNNPQYLQVIYNSAASRWRVIKASQ